MSLLSRRQFAQDSLASLLALSLIDALFERDAVAAEIKPELVRWLNDVNELGNDVRGQKIAQTDWQKKIEELFTNVDLPELLQFVDFDKLAAGATFSDRGEKSLRFSFQQIDGVPERLSFGRQIFALKKGRSVVPHGHNNMATAFLILRGRFQGRHFERLEDEPKHMIIKPTVDREFKPGECSTVSDFKDNVHWFTSIDDEPAFILNIHVLGVNPEDKRPTGRVYIDPNGEKISDERIRARIIGHDESVKLYG